MARRVFVSFVVEDQDLVNLFRGQAKNKNSDLEFSDYSVKEPYDSTNAPYIRSKIRERIAAAEGPICLIGQNPYQSKWAEWELGKGRDEGKKGEGVRGHGEPAQRPTPQALTDLNVSVVNWDVAAIVKLIG